jgi:hypothetical protein
MRTILLCTLIACGGGGGKLPSNAAAHQKAEGQLCSQEIKLVCPEGQIDACDKPVAEEPPAEADAEESGGTGTMMALEEGKMGKRYHRCVAK